MFSFFGSLISGFEHVKFALRNRSLCHSQSNTELSCCDVARTKSVEITEEFGDTDSLLLTKSADARDNILNIIRSVTNALSLTSSCLSLRVVVGAVIESLVNTEELACTINVLTEVRVVDLIDITLVHVTAQEGLSDMLWSSDAKEVEHSEELSLRYMLVVSDVVVLEDGFQMNALIFNGNSVFFENVFDSLLILLTCKVLSASKKCISSLDWGNSGRRCLINTSNCESPVHICYEVSVTEETLGVSGLVLLGQSLEFIICQRKVHG